MNKRNKIINEIKIQQSIEGHSLDTYLLLKILSKLNSLSEWYAIVKIKHYRYGKLSYEIHNFYYPSALLETIKKVIK